MPALFSNNASATLAASITSVQTSLTLTTGQGALFPAVSGSDYFYATIANSSNTIEIVKVTARSADVLTVVRAQEGTTASAFSSGDKVELRLTAAALNNMAQLDEVQTFSAAQTFSGTVALSGGGSLSGSFSGTATFSGNITFSNTITGSISGNAATVTNGVYTTGDQTIAGNKVFSNSVTVNGTFLSVGNGGTGDRQLYMHNSVRQCYFFLNTSSVLGLWDATSAAARWTTDAPGNFVATGNIAAYSDERLKTDWADLPSGFVRRLADVKSGTYTRIDNDMRQVGVSAQSLRELLPEAVIEDDNGSLSVSYGSAALAACVALAKEIQSIKAELIGMKGDGK